MKTVQKRKLIVTSYVEIGLLNVISGNKRIVLIEDAKKKSTNTRLFKDVQF